MKKKLLLLLGFTGIILSAQEKVGINTDNPSSTLHVNGNMNVRKLGTPVEGSIPITWNPTTHNFSAGGDHRENLKVYTFYMKTTNDNKNQIYADLNTKIDASKYEIIITDWQFDNERNSTTNYDNHVGIPHVKWSRNKLNPIPIIEAYIKGGEWHIKANYACTDFDGKFGPAYWTVECMILPKGFAKYIKIESSVEWDANSKPTGALAENPLKIESLIDNNVKKLDYVSEEDTGNVGIATNDPKATLHVNGKLRVDKLSLPANDAQFISVNKETGELIPTLLKGKKPIYHIRLFTPTDRNATNNNDRDRVNFFDTRIPKDRFYILLNRTTFTNGNGAIPNVGITHEHVENGDTYYYNPVKLAIITDKRPDGTISDTWGIRLDYINAGPDPKWLKNSNGAYPAWQIEALVISKDFMEDIADINMNGNYSREYIIESDGNATVSPPLKGLPGTKATSGENGRGVISIN